MQQRDRGLEDDDEQSCLFFGEIAVRSLIGILAIDSSGSKLQKVRLAERLYDGHGVRFVESILEYRFHLVELLIEGLFELLFGNGRDAGAQFLEAQQDNGEDIGHVLARIGRLQFPAFPQHISDQGGLFLGEGIPYLADLDLIHTLDPVIYLVDRLVGDELHPEFSGKLPNLPDPAFERKNNSMAKQYSQKTRVAVKVSSEIGRLRRVLVHSPDSGLGKVVPSKAQDWLFEDIVHLDTIRRKEYDFYTKILLYFLDPARIKGRLAQIDDEKNRRSFYKPGDEGFFRSDKVVELQWLLADILADNEIKLKLVASVCAIEAVSYDVQQDLQDLDPVQLAKTFISGATDDDRLLFAPIPNFIFTRDIGIVINSYVLLNKPAKKARTREALLAKYIFFNHPLFEEYRDKIIELNDTHHHFLLPREGDDRKVTLEGGDVMVVCKDHLLIGVSERTSPEAAYQALRVLFEKNVVKKITIIRIPKKRDFMHIDTIFTQVKKNVWILLGTFSSKAAKHEDEDEVQRILENNKKEDKLKIVQFRKKDQADPEYFDSLEDLLTDISRNDLECTEKVKFIYSGNNEFPFDAREQWTDSCNLLALKEGVVLGYDRNDKTVEAFRTNGFAVIAAEELIAKMEKSETTADDVENTLILMPSAELSRARGGFHCMSMPLHRDDI